MSDRINMPFGPRKEYAPTGFVPPIVEPKDTLIDPRTGAIYGSYSEDEIIESVSKTFATSTVTGIDEKVILPTEKALIARIESVPEQKEFHSDIYNIAVNKGKQAYNMSKINQLWNDYMDNEDPRILQDIEKLNSETDSLALEIPDNFDDHGLLHETFRTVAQVGGQMAHMARDIGPKIAASGASGAVTGAAIGPGGVAVGAATAVGVSAAGNVYEYSYRQMSGAIFSTLVSYEDEQTKAKLDPEISRTVARKWGAVSAVPEVAADAVMGLAGIEALVGKNVLSGVLEASAAEGGTEFVQAIIDSIALWDAKRQTSEKTGEQFTPQSFGDIIASARQQARGGILGGGGLVGAAGIVGQVSKYSSAAIRAIEDKGKAKYDSKVAGVKEADLIKAKQDVHTAKTEPVVPDVDPDTLEEIPATPVLPEEVTQAEESSVVAGTGITDGSIDDLVVAGEESIDSDISNLLNAAEDSVSDVETQFGQTLREIMPEDESVAIESLLQGRADSLGMTVSEYMDKRGISLVDSTDTPGPPGRTHGIVTGKVVLNETKAIITAFQGANVTTVAHELGHIFRRDLEGQDLSSIQTWLGVDPLSNRWSISHEELFAEAWEKYLADGIAPTQEMEGVFKKFTKWMLNMYRSLKNTPLDINIPPEVKAVFDRMLTADLTSLEKSVEIDNIPVELEQTAERIIAVKEGQREFREAIAHSQTHKEALHDYIKAQVRILQNLFDKGDTAGYKRARARLKATIARSRERSKMYKRHAYLRNKIIKLVKSVKPKRSAGKLVGKMHPIAQDFINDISPIIGTLSSLKGAKNILEMVEDTGWTNLTEPEIYAMGIVKHASVRSMESVLGLEAALKDLQEFINTGKSESPFAMNYAKAKKIAAQATLDAAGGVNLKEVLKGTTAEQAHRERQKVKSVKEKVATSTLGKDFLFGWGGLLSVISAYSSKENGFSAISTALDFFPSRQQYQTEVREAISEMADAYKRIYSIDEWGMNKKQNFDYMFNIDIGMPTKYNKAMLRQLWLYSLDPTLATRLENNGFTTEVLDSVREQMSLQDKQFALALRNMFSRDPEYNRNNEIYRRVFGTNLPRIDNYVPVASEPLGDLQKRGDKPESMFMADLHANRTPTTASALKARTKTDKAKLIINGDLGLFDSFTEEMAHFRSFAESVRLAKSVINDKDLKNAIIYEYGHGMYSSLVSALDATAGSGSNGGFTIQAIDRFRSAFVSSTIGMSLSVMSKQLISVANYWQKMPAKALADGLVDFWKNPVENWNRINNLDYMKNRVGNIDVDLKDITSSREYKKFRINPTLRNMLTLNVKLGDKAAIIIGGHAYAKYLQGQGLSLKEAMYVMAKESDKTQQSASTEERSRFQRGGTFPKLAATYSSGPVQAARQEIEAIRGWASGRMTKQQAIKTLFIYHVLVPVMYSAAASVISGEDLEEAYKNAMVAAALGPLGSSYSVGRTVNAAVKKVFGMKSYMDSGPFVDTATDISSLAKDIVNGDFEDITLDDTSSAIQGVLALSGRGVPLQRITRMGENAVEGNIKGTLLGSRIKE